MTIKNNTIIKPCYSKETNLPFTTHTFKNGNALTEACQKISAFFKVNDTEAIAENNCSIFCKINTKD